ncbi:glycoside hydrolase family 3 C-terminal domain-containing protein [Agreia sp. PsM10]|nr:glycoside hydrolase family 3 C-terminal domain-containing protein [Agreia sp. PsM10]MDN4640051.1 glycoside hydrolase family 3 C-terminal domain-containing protein [Agreia sp. PsM10]
MTIQGETVHNHANETDRLIDLTGRLSLEEKVQLITGRDFWTTWPIESIGLRRILVSDGPSGVRGEVWDERSPSLNLPSGTALSSSWDRDIAARYGAASAVEARRKGVDVVLGPTINLHRSPYGGRHFEAFSEDPLLTGDLAAAYVEGVQGNGVGATPKHYVANEFETDRYTADSVVSERALRELYLAAFEKSITEAHAWVVMSSYNSINGTTSTENDLLETPLNSEWGFDGVVVSDWTGVRSVDAASASQDLEMPGPVGAWGPALVDAVRNGRVLESDIDRKVVRILRLAARVGALEGFEPTERGVARIEDGEAFARTAASAGSVLLRNEGALLPLDPEAIRSVAIIGHNAENARTQGGGSATVIPTHVISPLDGIREALPAGVSVTYARGAVVQKGIAEFALAEIVNPRTGQNGALVRFLDGEGREIFAEDRFSTTLMYFGGDAPTATAAVIEISVRWTPRVSGDVLFGFGAAGRGRIYADGQLIREDGAAPVGMDLGASVLSPPSISASVTVQAGEPIDLMVAFDLIAHEGALAGAFGITVGIEADESVSQQLMMQAIHAAEAADVAIVVVGTNAQVESEGFDRNTLALPGLQDDLVRAVAAVNPRTVVVVNAGAPVLLPWRHEVPSVLLTYFGGQEYGAALADMLFGVTEPGGRLPTTWPATEASVPVTSVTPVDGKVVYDEGIHIGYRAWLRAEADPAYEFGFGLTYTTFTLDALELASADDDAIDVLVTVTNTGDRAGKEVVQVYFSRSTTEIDRPVRWLAGFEPVYLEAGGVARVRIRIASRAFEHWDGGWKTEPGEFDVHVGTSVTSTPLHSTTTR